ncbi:PQQ-dependent sugar dehydrogenase [soil metagenome]
MARALAIALLAATACGDNLHPPAAKDAEVSTRCTPMRGGTIGMRQIAYGCAVEGAPAAPDCLGSVLTLATAPKGDPRLFIVQQDGGIRLMRDEKLIARPFLTIGDEHGLVYEAELGLLGLAFHPAYATNRVFYVFYTARNPDTADTLHPYLDIVARYTTSATDPDLADPASHQIVLSVPDPFANHNGGMIEFGPDGYLYISIGDGGGRQDLPADPYASAQDLNVLLGKILRIDVDHPANGKPYGVPADNPYAVAGGAPEVWVRGLRNPWRFSIDDATGDLWIGDVGHAEVEELDVLRHGQQAGVNLGWPMWEGDRCYGPPCTNAGMTFPVATHDHAVDGWWSIIGGEVYRGNCIPDLVGSYVYTDCGHGHLYTAKLNADGTTVNAQLPGEFVGTIFQPTSLHVGGDGELYQTQIRGNVYKLVVEKTPTP